jgi:PhnB protein
MANVKPIPEGYHSVTPYLHCNGTSKAIDFYKQAFGAVEIMRMPGPGGKVSHAEIRVGDSHIMLSDEFPEMGVYGAQHFGGSPISILLYVANADKTVEQAVAAGATVKRPVADQFYGDRSGVIADPFGLEWYIHTHIKDVSPEEMRAAMQSQG